MNNNQMINTLTTILIAMIGILFVLCIIFITIKLKSNKTKSNSRKEIKNKEIKNTKSNSVQTYNKQSIFKFMEFDKIDDNMIVQKDGKRFLMAIECQGINYDLMSGLEKNSVEQGFLQFLNTLRYPIQIYIQTRTVNLGNSIHVYKDRVEEVSKQLVNKQIEYNQKVRSGQFSEEQLKKEEYEIVRQKNLYEYGVDIVNNTERMSLNKSILSKHYYIIIPYYPEEAADPNYARDEITNLAFSELYTKAQTIISSLAVCGINSKVLNSIELAELLYVAYNRDESEKMNLRRTLNAGYEDLYTTAPDVLDKRMKELDIKIQEEAFRKANETVFNVIEENEKQKVAKRKEEELDKLIDQMAKILIEENKRSIGEDVAQNAIQKIDEEMNNKTKEKGGEVDVKETKAKTTRRRTKKAV
ncbi:MAG: hypothetical protein HFJ59_07755 [Clostridia bacterium]|nr:hypothetical protein [Clostridia bacterium]